jgi:hypothetical protein
VSRVKIRKSEVLKISNLSITANNIILQAAQNLPLQGERSPADELLYYQARELYDLHAKGMITAAIGAERKSKIIAAYIINSNREQQYTQSNMQIAEFYKSIEIAGCNYAKNRTIENADQLYYEVYHMIPKGASI